MGGEGRGALAAHLLVNSCRDKKRADVGLAPFHLLTPLQTATESVPERAPAHPQSVSFRFINTDGSHLGQQRELSSQGPGVKMVGFPNDLQGTFGSRGAGVAEQEGRASWCPGEFHVTPVCENCRPGWPAQTRAGCSGKMWPYSASDFKHRYHCFQHNPL